MPPFSFMTKYFKFTVDTTTLPDMSSYSTLPVSQPTIMKLQDGSAAIKVDSYTSYWISSQAFNNLFTNAQEELEPKPPQNSITENTLLKALAIAQDPTLAINLIKE